MSALIKMAKDAVNDDKPLRALALAMIASSEELRAANEINKGHVDYIQRRDQRPGVEFGQLILAATDAISTMLREVHAGDEAYEEKRPRPSGTKRPARPKLPARGLRSTSC